MKREQPEIDPEECGNWSATDPISREQRASQSTIAPRADPADPLATPPGAADMRKVTTLTGKPKSK